MIRLHRLLWLPIGLVLMSSACSSSTPSTSLVELSVDERFVGQRVEQVLVIGLAYLPVNRQLFEDQVAAVFEGQGATALRSYELMGEVEVTRDTIVAALEGTGTDAVLLTRVVDFEHMSLERSPSTTAGSGAFGSYIDVNASSLRQPVEGGILVLETVLFELASEEPMWSAVTETFDPASVREVVEGVSDALLGSLRQHGFL